MKRTIFTLTITLILAAACLLALEVSRKVTQNVIAAQPDCYTTCSDSADVTYGTCKAQGGSNTKCRKAASDFYLSCVAEKCPPQEPNNYCQCGVDWRTNICFPCPGYDDGSGCGLTYNGGYSNPCDCNPDDPTCTSPILVDTANNGYRLTNVANGVHFDLRADGSALQAAWTEPGSDDAWLALDRNGNGAIDSGAELFGNFTPQPERVDKNGFLALAEYDKVANGGNADGQITSADSIFASLRLWQDRNHNGISELSELVALPSVGLNVLELQYKETRRMDRYANVFRYKAKTGWGWDVFLTHE